MSARRSVPPVQPPSRSVRDVRTAYRIVVHGDAATAGAVSRYQSPGRPLTVDELWQFLLDIPDGGQPVMAEVLADDGSVRLHEVRGVHAADGAGPTVIELVEARY